MARRLLLEGHEVTIVCGSSATGKSGLQGPFVDGRREGVVDGIRIVELELPYSNRDGFAKRSATFLRFAIQSTWIALRADVDLVFATTTPLTAGIPGIAARWLRGKPFVFEVRDLWPELPKAMGVIQNPIVLGAMSVLEWASYHSADRLIGLAPGIVEGINARGVCASRIAMIPNGCDTDLFASGEPSWRPQGVEAGDIMAVFTGAHGLANGLDAALDAARELQALQRNDIKLVLIGDGMMKPSLQQRAEAEGLHNVIFLDPVPKHKLVGLMAAADVGLQLLANVPAFYFGTSPNKFFDYLAAGLPVLNNYPGWLANLINANDCGYAVPADNPQLFAQALISAAEQRPETKMMGHRAKQLAEREFKREELSRRFVHWVTGVAA